MTGGVVNRSRGHGGSYLRANLFGAVDRHVTGRIDLDGEMGQRSASRAARDGAVAIELASVTRTADSHRAAATARLDVAALVRAGDGHRVKTSRVTPDHDWLGADDGERPDRDVLHISSRRISESGRATRPSAPAERRGCERREEVPATGGLPG